MLQGIQLR
jgi:DNA-directed RNA polymerase subunit A'